MKIRAVWEKDPSNFDHIMLRAACCTCFLEFLRSGEISVPSDHDYDPGAHLSYGDVTLDNLRDPQRAEVRIKASKTDPFRQGVSVFLGRTNTPLCPVAALAAYCAVRGSARVPYFRFKDGKPLTRERFVHHFREALAAAGLDPQRFAGHSFRKGAATTAAACGLEDSLLQTLGRWESNAYQLYIELPRERLAEVSQQLVPSPTR